MQNNSLKGAMASTSADMALCRLFASHPVCGVTSLEILCLNADAPYFFTVGTLNAASTASNCGVVARQP